MSGESKGWRAKWDELRRSSRNRETDPIGSLDGIEPGGDPSLQTVTAAGEPSGTRVWRNPTVPTDEGQHMSWKPYDPPGYGGRVFSVKLPSFFYWHMGLRPENSYVLIVPVDEAAKPDLPPRRTLKLTFYQLDQGEGGAARPCYAFGPEQGALTDVQRGDLVVAVRRDANASAGAPERPVFMFRAPNSPQGVKDRLAISEFPSQVSLTTREAKQWLAPSPDPTPPSEPPKPEEGGEISIAMRLEHVALNVVDPRAMAEWYVQHLGMRVVRKGEGPIYAHFLATAGGHTMLEIYRNPPDHVPDYASQRISQLHLAFVSPSLEKDTERLLAAGATRCEGAPDAEGFGVVTLRDPWGVPIQLCRRREPML
jgi:catechol 2,3-dioxygenase-like lactoylglutathione lyase family enzyme